MIHAPVPADEKQRLEDLRALSLLDTPPEDRFDRLVQLVQSIFSVPIAYIALVDSDRQWFKSQCGLQATQTGRDVSFCGHTILQQEPLIIPDARKDERFHDNPMVLNDPHVRFYAGHPLAGPKGHNVATLCVVDRQPRQLNATQLEILHQIAQLVEHELNLFELAETQRKLISTQSKLIATQNQLEAELAEAADYVQRMLPAPIAKGAVQTDYRFISSSQLGGDTFGYHWLDEAQTKLAMFVVDVTGHGVGSSLLSVTVGNTLRSFTLPNTDFSNPARVLAALNNAFPMEQNQQKFFTIWYGVYDRETRELVYSSAGHHPTVLVEPSGTLQQLGEPGLMIGVLPDEVYENSRCAIEPDSRLYLFSDGAFELRNEQGDMLNQEGLMQMIAQLELANAQDQQAGSVFVEASQTNASTRVDRLVAQIRRYQNQPHFADDFSLLEVTIR